MNSQSGRESDLERGATAVEYALMVALIAAVIFAVVTFLGLNVIPLYKLTF
jgi:Flp pilus assembly pilin Flp